MKNATLPFVSLLVVYSLALVPCNAQQDSIEPLIENRASETVDEVWGDYDPTVEPLEVEVYKEWVEDGTVLRAVRYCIGTFKGQKSWMAGFYSFPEGGKDLPALLQIHGGGGAASKGACIANAKRGYATFSINWRADNRYTKLEDLPAEAQTDWGAVEGRQVKESRGIEPNDEKRYDPVPSARNDGYFLRALAARRALTFLEQQPEVDGGNLGVDGHSMGGVITLLTAATDDRVKAAAPSCAPPLLLDGSLKARTANPAAYAQEIRGAMLFMSPSNDFHGMVEAVEWINQRMPSTDFRIARSEHLNHKHNLSSLAAKDLWFDSHLKNTFSYPQQPAITVNLKSDDALPSVLVIPDDSLPIESVDIFYSRDAKESGNATNRTRYWQFAKPEKANNGYRANLELFDLKDPLWVFANVHYQVPESSQASLGKASETFVVTTRLFMASPDELVQAKTKTNSQTTNVIESFEEGWEKEWIISGNKWESWRLNDPRVPMTKHRKLVLEVQSDEANSLSVSIGDFRGVFPIEGGAANQSIEILPFDLKSKKNKSSLLDWQSLKRPKISLSTQKNKLNPVFKRLAWEAISIDEFTATRPFQLGAAPRLMATRYLLSIRLIVSREESTRRIKRSKRKRKWLILITRMDCRSTLRARLLIFSKASSQRSQPH